MPRPGPRPYECVRRAWHSDRHQPIRGSLIQEIFRLANEVHCNGTKKNKEWQEKLPFVVLKAEEIMYSKANSEAEYMDLKTLWDRVNDAIDTIIRKDDANESGDLLQPCIEAALNLGCIPRRASRSQRHSNPIAYLTPNLKETLHPSQKSQENNNNAHQGSSTRMLPPMLPAQAGHIHSPPPEFGSKNTSEIQFMPSNVDNSSKEFPCIVRGVPLPKEPDIWPNLCRVYPLYYGEGHCTPNSRLQSHVIRQEETILSAVGAARPSVRCNGAGDIVFSAEFAVRKTGELSPRTECDLSLRLRPPYPPASEVESYWAHEIEEAGSSLSCDGSKSCAILPNGTGTTNLENSLSSSRDGGFGFFFVENIDEHYECARVNGARG
ncbi:hypothetical protein KSP39_PZI005562 [Platanthera zijinensis]|uniref:Histone acetyltransferase n=1 Tax=Platanthera zijinensis TaxID=2320716 RepID=A0AAP0BUQ0_9ASPA